MIIDDLIGMNKRFINECHIFSFDLVPNLTNIMNLTLK